MATISLPASAASAGRRVKVRRQLGPGLALLPTAIIVVVAYLGCMLWTVRLSFTSSKLLPKLDWVGFDQYVRLFENVRLLVSIQNIAIFGVLFFVGALVL